MLDKNQHRLAPDRNVAGEQTSSTSSSSAIVASQCKEHARNTKSDLPLQRQSLDSLGHPL